MRTCRFDKFISHSVWTFKRSDGLTKQYVKKRDGSIEIWVMDIDWAGAIKVREYKYQGKLIVWDY